MAKSRSRMISDKFWNDPDLVNYTVETRTTLLLFLTCMESNIIGVYRVNWRTVGAGLGWTREQSINAAKLVAELGGIAIDEDSGWIWVKEWWKHNSLLGAFTGNVAKPARQELERVPDFWKTQVLDWIKTNDAEGACKELTSPLVGAGGNPNPIIPNNTTLPPSPPAPLGAACSSTRGEGGMEEIDYSNLTGVTAALERCPRLSLVLQDNGQVLADALEASIRWGARSGKPVNFPDRIVEKTLLTLPTEYLEARGSEVRQERKQRKAIHAAHEKAAQRILDDPEASEKGKALISQLRKKRDQDLHPRSS